MAKFIHLHTHSHYSLLDGLSKIEKLVSCAKEYKMPALAITDHGNLYGAIEFYKLAKKEGIKPIIGVEAYIACRSRLNKESGVDNIRYHLTLLAKNLNGYKNLIKLVTISHLEGYYYKPRMDKEILKKYSDGIIALSGCFGGELARALSGNDIKKAENVAKEYREIFGAENYFLEIMKHTKVKNSEIVYRNTIELGKKLNIPLVATIDSHYTSIDDKKAHETFLSIQTNTDIKNENKFSFGEDDFSFINSEEAERIFSDIPEAIENTLKIANECNIELELGKWVFPNFLIEDSLDSLKSSFKTKPDESLPITNREEIYNKKLENLTYLGIKDRNLEESEEALKRVKYELEIIAKKGFAPYFLIVWDILRYTKENKILTAIRGSVAGSMVTYLLRITDINPIEYKLPFERFLNPYRPSPPDIDMDFADNRRDNVIEYVKNKYGHEKVAQIGTFGTMAARGSVRDIARALGYPYSVGDRISKLIPIGPHGTQMTIDHAIEIVPELKKMYETETETTEIINLAKKIEGAARHISVHAAGVVIAPTDLTNYTPLQFDPNGGKIITQYDMYTIEDVGLLKFDFLGIRNLSILADTINLVKKIHNVEIDINNIPLNDKKTFNMLSKGETEGVFQLNGSGMTRFLKELRPSSIHDINAMIALYRPGPIESIPEYIKRRHNPELVKYLDPRTEKFLKESYGLIVYQDDLLFCAIELAGYNWEEADKLRKAVGKKIPAEMAAQKEKFIKGIITNGQNQAFAEKLWKIFEPFQAYGFNKAHAASYGRVAYQTAYAKAHYPVEYMNAILTAESGDIEKIALMVKECKRMSIQVLPPNINESFGGFTVIKKQDDDRGYENKKDENKIRFGLYTIKNLGVDIADAIISERKINGKFKSIGDFLNRIKHKNLNKKSLEALIKSGSMDDFGERGALFENIQNMLDYHHEVLKNGSSKQMSLFGETLQSQFKLKDSKPASQNDKLLWEKELLGLYVSGHPLDHIKDKLEKKEMNIKNIKDNVKDGTLITVAGIIDSIRLIVTKNSEQMAFLKISDLTDSIEAVVFPRSFQEFSSVLINEKCIALCGKVSLRSGEKSIIIEAAKEI